MLSAGGALEPQQCAGEWRSGQGGTRIDGGDECEKDTCLAVGETVICLTPPLHHY